MNHGAAARARIAFRQNPTFFTALVLFFALLILYNYLHPRGFTSRLLIQNANESVTLGFLAVAQTFPVLLGGIDLSVGAVMTLANTVASVVVTGGPAQTILGIVLTLASGTAFGLLNGLVIVYGRLQPIIATLATGAIAIGIALFIRPSPGGNIDPDLSWALTNALFDFAETYGLFDDGNAAWFQPIAWIPVPLILLFAIVIAVWLPVRRTVTGRSMYAIGSAEGAAFMSGLPMARAKITAFTLGGFFAACAGLYLAIQTSSGNADIPQAGQFTLNSIAAVVIGGASLLGGVGGAIGSLIGALILRLLSFYFRILSIDPLLQPLVEGFVLLVAVSLGALHALRVKNRLELFK